MQSADDPALPPLPAHCLPLTFVVTNRSTTVLRNRRAAPASGKKPIEQQQTQGANDRRDDSRAFTRIVIPAECPPQEPSKQGAGHADQHGNDDSARIAP